jgi:hypothetical protein
MGVCCCQWKQWGTGLTLVTTSQLDIKNVWPSYAVSFMVAASAASFTSKRFTMRPLTKTQSSRGDWKFQNIILWKTTYKNWGTLIKLPSKNYMIDDYIFLKGRNGVSLLSYLRTQGGLETTRNQLNFVLIQPEWMSL